MAPARAADRQISRYSIRQRPRRAAVRPTAPTSWPGLPAGRALAAATARHARRTPVKVLDELRLAAGGCQVRPISAPAWPRPSAGLGLGPHHTSRQLQERSRFPQPIKTAGLMKCLGFTPQTRITQQHSTKFTMFH